MGSSAGFGRRNALASLPQSGNLGGAIDGEENRPFIPLSMTREALTMAIEHIAGAA